MTLFWKAKWEVTSEVTVVGLCQGLFSGLGHGDVLISERPPMSQWWQSKMAACIFSESLDVRRPPKHNIGLIIGSI